ncbi:MAG: hypothetical protein U5K56_00460 [Halioglobus sp.]|nr:hypothetical protein [Halioglobus sp.]
MGILIPSALMYLTKALADLQQFKGSLTAAKQLHSPRKHKRVKIIAVFTDNGLAFYQMRCGDKDD